MVITIERNQKIQNLQIKDNIYIYICGCVGVWVCVWLHNREIYKKYVLPSKE